MSIESLKHKIEVAIVELCNNRLLKSSIKNKKIFHWDEKMRRNWIGLKVPPISGLGDKESILRRRDCVWKAPKEGWFKLNFDRASRGIQVQQE